MWLERLENGSMLSLNNHSAWASSMHKKTATLFIFEHLKV